MSEEEGVVAESREAHAQNDDRSALAWRDAWVKRLRERERRLQLVRDLP